MANAELCVRVAKLLGSGANDAARLAGLGSSDWAGVVRSFHSNGVVKACGYVCSPFPSA